MKLSIESGVYSGDTEDPDKQEAFPSQGDADERGEVSISLKSEPLMAVAGTLSGGLIGSTGRHMPWTPNRGGLTGTSADVQDRGNPEDSKVQVRSADQLNDEDRGLSFEQIHRKYNDKIYNLILRYVGDPDDAGDLTQETFVNAYKAWDRFRHDAKVSTWLYTIAHNCCKNRFKQKDRQREREPMSLDETVTTDGGEVSREVPDWSHAPERLLLDQELAEQIRKAVDALPEDYKVVLVLAQREEMSYEQIAQITGLSVPAVKTRLHRARSKMRQRLEPYYRNWSRGGA